jgi:integrase
MTQGRAPKGPSVELDFATALASCASTGSSPGTGSTHRSRPGAGARSCSHPRSSSCFLTVGGLDVVFVSRQLGHANPGITLQVYSHLFAARDHADTVRQVLDASHTALNGTSA